MSLCYDLHTHSTMSDGSLSPAQLVESAARMQVDVLALTDHDTTEGLEQAELAGRRHGVRLVPGVEVSVTWNGMTIHIVGLNIDPSHTELRRGLAAQRAFREWRAEEIGRRLEKVGIGGAYQAARCYAQGPIIGRTHFARFLVDQGYAPDMRTVFKRFLVKRKPGHVRGEWANLEQVLGWIHAAGGEAVIAHPARYRLSATRLRHLIGEFIECGGVAMEVVSGSHSPNDSLAMAGYARRFGLLASCGSDYHGPENPWIELGGTAALPAGCTPIWKTASWRLYEEVQEGYPLQSDSERWPRG